MERGDLHSHILSATSQGDALLIVPPFGATDDVPNGPHVLQSLSRRHGHRCDILYLNLLLAADMGVECYAEVNSAPEFWMLAERLTCRCAYGLPPLGRMAESTADESEAVKGAALHAQMFYDTAQPFDFAKYLAMEAQAHAFFNEAISIISRLSYSVIGCTAVTGQVNGSVALLSGIKRRRPEVITIIGGANCEGDMAKGIASLTDDIDYIFSGESELSFLEFLRARKENRLPDRRIINGSVISDLSELPMPDYTDYFEQYRQFLGPDDRVKRIWYETSRGCWWAEKSKCTFCGIPRNAVRRKKPDQIVKELVSIQEKYRLPLVHIADNSMPPSFDKTLLPLLEGRDDTPDIGYQARATLSLKALIRLRQAKVCALLPGIETFSSRLLKSMRKGTLCRHNVLLLRNAASVGIYLDWGMLWGFPGDTATDYEDTLRLIPLLRHLQPPKKFYPMVLMRFSPYLETPATYGIRHVRPWNAVEHVYPEWANKENLTTYYFGEFSSEGIERPDLIRAIADELALWRRQWTESALTMTYTDGAFVVHDTRPIREPQHHVLRDRQAEEIMSCERYQESQQQHWATENKLGILIDDWYVPLVTAPPQLLLMFEPC